MELFFWALFFGRVASLKELLFFEGSCSFFGWWLLFFGVVGAFGGSGGCFFMGEVGGVVVFVVRG